MPKLSIEIFSNNSSPIILHDFFFQCENQQNFPVGSGTMTPNNPNNPNIIQEHPLNQQIQFVRSPLDGKIVVLGLLPGQQVVQLPHDAYQIISRPMGVLNPTLNKKE